MLVLISSLSQMREAGNATREAVLDGARRRLRPVLMTAFVASFGFIPVAISTSTGAEVQRPLASVVIGGLFSSTLLTLLILPVLYDWFGTGEGPVGRPIGSERDQYCIAMRPK
jgi:cobalt-zinc-cadmium resistance protein CzcA